MSLSEEPVVLCQTKYIASNACGCTVILKRPQVILRAHLKNLVAAHFHSDHSLTLMEAQ